MKLILDTHILLWWLSNSSKLLPSELDLITNPDNLIFVSAAAAWEITVKRMIGKLDAPDDLPSVLAANDFIELPITIEHTQALHQLPPLHNDPFDRIMIAQALSENLTFITRDSKILLYSDLSFLP
jgi:PIN domain nuclease of toxin-antitoxin system